MLLPVARELYLHVLSVHKDDNALKTQNINTLTPSFLSGCRKQTTQCTHTHTPTHTYATHSQIKCGGRYGGKTPCWIIQLDAISRHNARYAPPSLHSTANGNAEAANATDEVAIQSHKHVQRGRKVAAKLQAAAATDISNSNNSAGTSFWASQQSGSQAAGQPGSQHPGIAATTPQLAARQANESVSQPAATGRNWRSGHSASVSYSYSYSFSFSTRFSFSYSYSHVLLLLLLELH
ncbi:LOW QUALITY PROTEIN: uncharacterized protein Dmoj_GI10701, partial [Drosophila mojavensis]